jgi:four helix bundle protein
VFGHEKLDVYRLALQFVVWSYRISKELQGIDRHARDQLLRASQSIPLNIAEGNGRRSSPDRQRFFQIAYGSAVECAAILDVLHACESISADASCNGKAMLNRIVCMLVKMTVRPRDLEVRECQVEYGGAGTATSGGPGIDYDYDCDCDYDSACGGAR